ncbi:hypothetical protein [Nocardioides sp. B-3]|uniref:hypothetical protein n=1 Tax=Nocardioides sp. B-3 TaxID=2895565 RepID=UPI0021530853|nr:hypothetical protein [Nocardioides sp. B-3]UUZ57692.1 hypothetical protein LP418_14740 [Nocardioides sp. B-3]
MLVPDLSALIRQVRRDGQIRETELHHGHRQLVRAHGHRTRCTAGLAPGAGAGRGPHARASGRGRTP